MPIFTVRPMTAADLPAVLAVQAQCYGETLLESEAALASRLALSPDTCWVAPAPGQASALAAYLFTHAWPESSLPPLDGVLSRQHGNADHDTSHLTWFVHDMAVAPAGRGAGLAGLLYRAASLAAVEAGLRRSRLIAVQSAAAWWRRLGYAPLDAGTAAPHAAKLASYGADAVIMERRLAA